jgi:hypothetical protein
MNFKTLSATVVAMMVVASAVVLHHRSTKGEEPGVELETVAGEAGSAAADGASAQSPARAFTAGPASMPKRHEEGAFDPLEAKFAQEDRLLQLDDNFRAEPVSVDWAARSSAEIRHALSTESLAEFNAPAPQALEVSCRSTGCRISMEFDNAITAPDTVTALTVGIASRFPEVVVLPVQGEQGGMQYHVFATTGRGSKLLRRDSRG